MGFWQAFLEASTPEGRQARYQRSYQRLTGMLPMRKKQDHYNLELVAVNWHQNGTVGVHLHGHKRGFKHTKRIERITLKMVPGLTEQEAVRCAAFMSTNEWLIPTFSNISRYRKNWNMPLDARLQAALTDPRFISVSSH
jgi:hypothetical protein